MTARAMHALENRLRVGVDDCHGASAVEYAMMAGILALGLGSAFTGLLGRLQNALNILAF